MAQTLTHSQSVRNNCALESSDPCLLWLIFKVQQPKQRVSCGIEKSSRRKVKAYVLLDLRKTFPFTVVLIRLTVFIRGLSMERDLRSLDDIIACYV